MFQNGCLINKNIKQIELRTYQQFYFFDKRRIEVLQNYTGNLIQNKKNKISYKLKKRIDTNVKIETNIQMVMIMLEISEKLLT